MTTKPCKIKISLPFLLPLYISEYKIVFSDDFASVCILDRTSLQGFWKARRPLRLATKQRHQDSTDYCCVVSNGGQSEKTHLITEYILD